MCGLKYKRGRWYIFLKWHLVVTTWENVSNFSEGDKERRQKQTSLQEPTRVPARHWYKTDLWVKRHSSFQFRGGYTSSLSYLHRNLSPEADNNKMRESLGERLMILVSIFSQIHVFCWKNTKTKEIDSSSEILSLYFLYDSFIRWCPLPE